MDKPKEKYWTVTRQDVGTEWGNPNYVRWCEERIVSLEFEIATLHNIQQAKIGMVGICDSCKKPCGCLVAVTTDRADVHDGHYCPTCIAAFDM